MKSFSSTGKTNKHSQNISLAAHVRTGEKSQRKISTLGFDPEFKNNSYLHFFCLFVLATYIGCGISFHLLNSICPLQYHLYLGILSRFRFITPSEARKILLLLLPGWRVKRANNQPSLYTRCLQLKETNPNFPSNIGCSL